MTVSLLHTSLLRPMMQADLERVLAWRNHPSIRKHMYTQKEISFEEHLSWFKQASVDADRYLLIFEVDDEPQGYVNFRCDSDRAAVWGFYLAPDASKGFGSLLGKAATRYAFEELHIEKLWGEVLIDNLTSHKFHLRQGFVEQPMRSVKASGEQSTSEARRYLLTRETWQGHQGVAQ